MRYVAILMLFLVGCGGTSAITPSASSTAPLSQEELQIKSFVNIGREYIAYARKEVAKQESSLSAMDAELAATFCKKQLESMPDVRFDKSLGHVWDYFQMTHEYFDLVRKDIGHLSEVSGQLAESYRSDISKQLASLKQILSEADKILSEHST